MDKKNQLHVKLLIKKAIGLNIFYSWQNMTKDWAEQKSYV